jgi:hypothetical protein
MPKTSTARDRAVELEQDAVRCPEERGEILLEAAEAWKEAGEPDRAVALWRELIEAGGAAAARHAEEGAGVDLLPAGAAAATRRGTVSRSVIDQS